MYLHSRTRLTTDIVPVPHLEEFDPHLEEFDTDLKRIPGESMGGLSLVARFTYLCRIAWNSTVDVDA